MDSGKHFKPTLPTAQQVLEDLIGNANVKKNTNLSFSDPKLQNGYEYYKNSVNLQDNLINLHELTTDLEHLQQVLADSLKPTTK